MIQIEKSPTADTRTCDFANVSEQTLLISSIKHIKDVNRGLDYFIEKMERAKLLHDHDKVSDIKGFHKDFISGFKETTWWDKHRQVNRHHLLQVDGIPNDVNLVDVIEMITDCVMAGMARSGSVYPLELPVEVLQTAFNNTVEQLKQQVVVKDE